MTLQQSSGSESSVRTQTTLRATSSCGMAKGGVCVAFALALVLCGASTVPLQLQHDFNHEAQRHVPQRTCLALRVVASIEGFERGG